MRRVTIWRDDDLLSRAPIRADFEDPNNPNVEYTMTFWPDDATSLMRWVAGFLEVEEEEG